MPSMQDILGDNPTMDAMRRHGVDQSVLFPQNPLATYNTPMAAGFDPNMNAPEPYGPTPMPNGSPMSDMHQVGQGGGNPYYGGGDPMQQDFIGSMSEPQPQPISAENPAGTPMQQVKDEAYMIAEVLGKRLTHHSKMEQAAIQPSAPAAV